jgi:hypothetical protein
MRGFGLVLLALVISASAIDQTRFVIASNAELDKYGKLESKEDVVNFLKGVAYGLDVVMGDPTACIRDVTNMTSDFNDGVQLIAHGIKTLNVKSVMEGLFAFADGVQKLADAFKACGIEKTAESITKIVEEIKDGQVMAFVKDEVMHIFSHGRELIHLFKDVAAEWKDKNFYEAGKDVGEILGILIDQENLQIAVTPAPQDIYNLIRGVAEGMGSSMGDPSGCARDLDIIVAQMNAAWSDLKSGLKHLSVKTIERALQEFADAIETIGKSLDACGLTGLEDAIRDIVADIRAGKVFQVLIREAAHIFCHGKELLDDFKSVASFWTDGQFEDCGKKVGEIIGFLVVIPPAMH